MINNYVIESVDYMLPPDIEVYEYEIYYNKEEIWRDIHFIENGIEYDFRGLYQVSTDGRVKSLGNDKTKKEKILKAKNRCGYEYVNLSKNGKRKNFTVHRLVAHMFLSNDNPIEKIEVNHIDENKENNHISNLEWCTREYNMNFGTRNERVSKMMKGKNKGENSPNHGELIAQIDKDTDKILNLKYNMEYDRLEFNQGHISSCCRGKRKTHKGYTWKYISDCTDEQLQEYYDKK